MPLGSTHTRLFERDNQVACESVLGIPLCDTWLEYEGLLSYRLMNQNPCPLSPGSFTGNSEMSVWLFTAYISCTSIFLLTDIDAGKDVPPDIWCTSALALALSSSRTTLLVLLS